MIDAKEALFRSKNQQIINKILERVEKHILEQSAAGYTTATVGVYEEIDGEAEKRIIENLENKGYKVYKITDDRDCLVGYTVGDYIIVDWGGHICD